jgi:WD40 repeat protein
VNAAAFSPDGLRIVTASNDWTARIWDAATGQPIAQPLQHRGELYTAVFSPNGQRIVTASKQRTFPGKPLPDEDVVRANRIAGEIREE